MRRWSSAARRFLRSIPGSTGWPAARTSDRSRHDRLASILQCKHDGAWVEKSDKPLHILVIDADRIRASIIEDGLRDAGHDRVTVIDDITRLMRRIVEIDPDVIVIDLENPNRDVLEHMFQVSRAAKRPVAMFVDRSDHGLDRGGDRCRACRPTSSMA